MLFLGAGPARSTVTKQFPKDTLLMTFMLVEMIFKMKVAYT